MAIQIILPFELPRTLQFQMYKNAFNPIIFSGIKADQQHAYCLLWKVKSVNLNRKVFHHYKCISNICLMCPKNRSKILDTKENLSRKTWVDFVEQCSVKSFIQSYARKKKKKSSLWIPDYVQGTEKRNKTWTQLHLIYWVIWIYTFQSQICCLILLLYEKQSQNL